MTDRQQGTQWLEDIAKLAKQQDTRHVALQEQAVLLQLSAFVETTVSSILPTVDKDSDNNGNKDDTAEEDASIFDEPRRASPTVSATLVRAFSVLRDSCAGCPRNQNVLRSTGLSDLAFKFSIDQASFACGAAPAVAASVSLAPGKHGTTSVPAAAAGSAPTSSANSIRSAVRAALQFVCNFCVGNEANKASLWNNGFPRMLMELVNGLKTDRRLLLFAIAIIHNCCVATPHIERESTEIGGEERIRQLAADRAFCCLLMKVVTFDPTLSSAPSASTSTDTEPTDISSSSRDDPAAEWLYLLFCLFVQEGLLSDVYNGVGIRAGGRSISTEKFDRAKRTGDGRDARNGGVLSPGEQGDAEPLDSGELWRTIENVKNGDRGTTPAAPENTVSESRGRTGEEDFFFPVTPEQLIMLNLTEVTAGDEAVTGGQRPTPQQQKACYSTCFWLIGLLTAMPLNQSLVGNGGRGVGEGGGGESELTRSHMREEARSAVLRALATLLAGCDNETRRRASTWGREGRKGAADSATSFEEAHESITSSARTWTSNGSRGSSNTAEGSGDDEGRFSAGRVLMGTADTINSCDSEFDVSRPTDRTPALDAEGAEPGLVPVCLRLLRGCGGAADPKAGIIGSDAREPPEGTGRDRSEEEGLRRRATERLGVPADRKVELLKVIGNACFRCEESQDLVRQLGALPLILNHCAVDGANPLLREYALLAVRNLCEGNVGNQTSIAALQPQGCSPGMDEALADMGLQGRVDKEGEIRLDARPGSL